MHQNQQNDKYEVVALRVLMVIFTITLLSVYILGVKTSFLWQ